MLIPTNLLDAAEELADAAEEFLEAARELTPDLEDYDGDEDSFAAAMEDYVALKKDAHQTLARSLRDFRNAEMWQLYARTLERFSPRRQGL
jgi:hypothetical protein